MIGVLPKAQGKGYASRLLNPILNKMSRVSIPVYLETANVNNVGIYQNKGFKTYNTWFKNGLELYYMKRES
jgi:GNAT superfamily N-acetyltransferase